MRHVMPILSAIVFLGITLASSAVLLADPPRPPPPPDPAKVKKGASTVSPSVEASASAVPTYKHTPEPVPLDKLSIPTTPSPRPTLDEWKGATLVELTRTGTYARFCKAYLVREWLKYKCDLHIAGFQQHGGSSENVFFWAPDWNWAKGWSVRNGGELMIQLRPGDRRVIQIHELVPEMCRGMGPSPSLMFDEVWLEGEKGPTVVVR